MSHLSMTELSASLDGSLTGPDSGQLLAHLSDCVLCQEQQARYALHDGALRRLFQQEPEEGALADLARDVIERITGFTPPEDVGPATIQQDTTATPADPSRPLPPAREPSRGMHRLGTEAATTVTPLEVAPRLDTERVPAAKTEEASGPLMESYDAFNDTAYAGPATREPPPMLGRPPAKKEGDADAPAPRKEYRHGGVRRHAPASSDRAREAPSRRRERPGPARREDGFGVRREQEPAWVRLGLEPDPSSPGAYRETLTGAKISPPAGNASGAGSRSSAARRTVLIASLAVVGGLAVVALAMRIPTGARLSVRSGRSDSAPADATPRTITVQSATTPPPVDVAVPLPAGGLTTAREEPRVCGQVVDARGRPVAGALLTVASTTMQTRTGADGRFCLRAPAGTQWVDLLDPRGSGTIAHRVEMSFVQGAPEALLQLP